MKLYALYDDNDMCVGVFEGAKKVAEFAGVETESVYCAYNRGNKIGHKYQIETIENVYKIYDVWRQMMVAKFRTHREVANYLNCTRSAVTRAIRKKSIIQKQFVVKKEGLK